MLSCKLLASSEVMWTIVYVIGVDRYIDRYVSDKHKMGFGR